jgi:hypothetical protein
MTLIYIAQQFTLYFGFFLLIGGLIGNAMNVLIFSKVRTYRTTPCTFYFLIGSIVNFFYLLLNLTARILTVSYGIDLLNKSSIECKLRFYFLITPTIISMSCSCLAAIDQFLVTSRSARLRTCSTIQWAHRIVFIVIIVSCLHGIPVIVYYDISPISKTCAIINEGFSFYAIVYTLGIVCAIPSLIMIVFAWLTYRNIQQTRTLADLQADRQLVKMTFIQVVLIVTSIVPYGIYNVYSLFTQTIFKDVDRQLKEYLASSVFSMGTYFFNSVC